MGSLRRPHVFAYLSFGVWVVITLTPEVVEHVTGDSPRWFVPLRDAALSWMIDTKPRLTMWLAQCSHESQGFRRLIENLNYSVEGLKRTWPRRFTPNLALACAHKPEKIADVVYQGRLGNVEPGDSFRFRGRGILMITGRENYIACGEALGLDLIATPDLLLRPQYAAESAAWFWYSKGLNDLADAMDYAAITRKINGGLNGMADRLARLKSVQEATTELA